MVGRLCGRWFVFQGRMIPKGVLRSLKAGTWSGVGLNSGHGLSWSVLGRFLTNGSGNDMEKWEVSGTVDPLEHI